MLNHQLHICNVTNDDLIQINEILLVVAEKFSLIDNTEDSRVENTIKSVVDRTLYWDGMGARRVGDMIIFDFNQRTENPTRMDAIHAFVSAELKRTFPSQLRCPEKQDFIEARITLPVTDEMKARAARLMTEKLRNRPNENA